MAFSMKTALVSQPVQSVKSVPAPARASLVVRAQNSEVAVTRRSALGLVAGAAALLSANSAEAAFGDAARVFSSKATNNSGFVPYSGEGYALLLPAKWNPSKEREFPGIKLRYEDNGDAVNNVMVITQKTSKSSVEDFGAPDEFLKTISYLLGSQTYAGITRSEGGFLPNKVAAASLLGVDTAKDKQGKSYYRFDILNRTADGDEGGRHQLITAAVGNGNLYVCKIQVGDKRWFKGVSKDAKSTWNSFVVA